MSKTGRMRDGTQEALDVLWRGVDALGGTYTPEQHASGYAYAHSRALDALCQVLEDMGAERS